MKITALLLSLILTFPVYASGPYRDPPPPAPTPMQPVPTGDSDHSNRNVLLLGVLIAAGVCWYKKCLEEKTAKDPEPNRITPEIPDNRIRIQPR